MENWQIEKMKDELKDMLAMYECTYDEATSTITSIYHALIISVVDFVDYETRTIGINAPDDKGELTYWQLTIDELDAYLDEFENE